MMTAAEELGDERGRLIRDPGSGLEETVTSIVAWQSVENDGEVTEQVPC